MTEWVVSRVGNSTPLDVLKSLRVKVVDGSYIFYDNDTNEPVAIHPATEYRVKRKS